MRTYLGYGMRDGSQDGHLETTGKDTLFQVGIWPKVVLEIMRATVLISTSLLRGIWVDTGGVASTALQLGDTVSS
jgi:hypothetical protein